MQELLGVTDPTRALETLRHGEEPARRRAVADLAGSGRPEGIAPLLLAVGDESWAVRQAAIEALVGFPVGHLLPALEAALRDDDDAGSRNASNPCVTSMRDSCPAHKTIRPTAY